MDDKTPHLDYSEYTEINPNYVYLTIPAEWVCVYHKLLIKVSEFGKVLLDDCTASCKGDGKNVINCWNLFQSAIASKALGLDEQADLFIKYIEKQMNLLYGAGNNKDYYSTNIFPISEDGELKALVSCDNDTPRFYLNIEDGRLYQKDESNKSFSIDNDHLLVKSNNNI